MVPADELEVHLREEGNRALASAAKMTLALALLGSLSILSYRIFLDGPDALDAPLLMTAWGVLSSLGVWRLASRRALHGPMAYPVLAAYASLPTLLFIGSHFMLPSGAATFIHGPMSFLYAVLIVLSGTLLRPRIPIVVAAFVALSLLACAELAGPGLSTIRAPDPTLVAELTVFFVWLNKAMMLLFVGLVTSGLTLVARRLAVSVRAEAGERARVRRVFGQYVSDEVAHHLLAEGTNRGGHRQEVVVLFSDIRGFTSFSETAAPDEIIVRLNLYFDAMVGAIHANGGVVDKFIGDAVMAVFGGVLPHESPAQAALDAALAMQAALAKLNARWRDAGEAQWRIGIGVHGGEVVLGSVGSASRRDFTVLGDAVNTASRLEGLTKEMGTALLLSEAVAEQLKDRAQVTRIGEVAIRGRARPLTIYGLAPIQT